MMLEFRQAAAANNVPRMEAILVSGTCKIDEPGTESGKTAAHVAAERGNFLALYWLFGNKADFYLKDVKGKTPIDYLQASEMNSVDSQSMVKGDRKYSLCNTHYKIWLAHDPDMFMPYLYQDDFRQYRERNPEGYISLVYSKTLLSEKAFSDLVEFAEKYRITLISFERDLAELTQQFGTLQDKQCYELASHELQHYPNEGGGNLAVVSDLIRWSSVLLRIGNYSDTDVEIGQHSWTESIEINRPLAMNIGSLIYPTHIVPWVNGDILATPSLLSRAMNQGTFKVVLSKAALFMIKNVQSIFVSSCQQKMASRIAQQREFAKIVSSLSLYLKAFFNNPIVVERHCINDHFSSKEIKKLKESGLEQFSKKGKSSIIERVAKIIRASCEEKFETRELAHEYHIAFHDVKDGEQEKFLTNYMRSLQMEGIKEGVTNLTGSVVFAAPLARIFGGVGGDWKGYSIYLNPEIASAFRSTNTVKIDTSYLQYKEDLRTKKLADLSFTTFGMWGVLERSEELKAAHHKK